MQLKSKGRKDVRYRLRKTKQLQADSRQENKQHSFNAALLDSVGSLIVVYNRQGRIIRFN
jgi:PAS domain-containing protein